MKLADPLAYFLRPGEKRLKTVWEVEKDGKKNFLVGTAHFFPYHFRVSLKKILRRSKQALFEGPLDPRSMEKVVAHGSQGEGSLEIYEALDPQTIREIQGKADTLFGDPQVFRGIPGKAASLFGDSQTLLQFLPRGEKPDDPVRAHFQKLRPWLAFFTIWTSYLKTKGWTGSVDLEAFELSKKLGKEVHFLETIEEQIQVLEQIPMDRMIGFLRRVDRWDEYSESYVRVFLRGCLADWMSGTSDFPSRCAPVISERDRVFYHRMKPFIEKGESAVFLGAPHLHGVNRMLEADGYRVEQIQEIEGW
jgi:uncharacterized protein YbaP (TraB family)